MKDVKVILIQGALERELDILIAHLKDVKKNIITNYEFYEGMIDDKKVILSKTEVGTINSSLATTLGILNYHPDIIINQGIAGAHQEDLSIGNIIIGTSCVNINAYKMPIRQKMEGSNSLEWEPNKRAKEIYYSDEDLVRKVETLLTKDSNNMIYKGVLGSGDVFNREYDRIHWIHNYYHNLCEDMESIGTYIVCNRFQVPCIGIRIISNNELTQQEMDKSVAGKLQELLLSIIKFL